MSRRRFRQRHSRPKKSPGLSALIVPTLVRLRHQVWVLAAMLILTGCAAQGVNAQSLPKQLQEVHTIQVGDLEREYRMFVPPQIDPSRPVPLVLVFHGGGDTSANIADYSQFYPIAEREGFIAVYPQGIGRLWYNMGAACRVCTNPSRPIDDVAFVRALIDRLKTRYAIDPKRIYATGMSLGAIFSYHLACRMSDTIAAIGPVAGMMITTDCNPAQPVAVLHIHPKQDEHAPFEGGRGRHTGRGNEWPPVQKGLDFWRVRNGCQEPRQQIDQGPENTCWAYPNCSSHKPVELCVVEGGHQWPGQEGRKVWQKLTGTEVSHNFPASERIWAFFKNNPR